MSGNYKTIFMLIATQNQAITFSFVACSDADSNHSPVVHIGPQTWMAENIKTSHYSNGAAIPKVSGYSNWDDLSLTSKAYCWYNDDSVTNANKYGALYTWTAAMNDAVSSSVSPSGVQGICPNGWHLPSDLELTTLENYLISNGFNYDGTTSGNKIGKSLASTTNWTISSVPGVVGNTDYPTYRNLTGFTALPSGYRDCTGSFGDLGSISYSWSSTEYDASYGWYMNINSNSAYAANSFYIKNCGYSVRCLKN
jgi:uncharacterized protein (TIGR02145 family)